MRERAQPARQTKVIRADEALEDSCWGPGRFGSCSTSTRTRRSSEELRRMADAGREQGGKKIKDGKKRLSFGRFITLQSTE